MVARGNREGGAQERRCYLLETGISDTRAGAILGMTPEPVRHTGKRARAYMIAVGTAAKVIAISQASMAH
ncbi:MAG: hypothetical protein U5M50_09830 [Sphingobium sp.]|nr:hypothetical protein [Sphingobium sp.]